MKNGTVGETYVKALISVAAEKHMEEKVEKELEYTDEVCRKIPVLVTFIQNAGLSAEKKQLAALLAYTKDNFSNTLKNFITVLVKRKRLDILPYICNLYKKEKNRLAGITTGVLKLANSVDKNIVAEIEKRLSGKLGKTSKLRTVIEPELIGGFNIKIDGREIDGSLAGELRKLQTKLEMQR